MRGLAFTGSNPFFCSKTSCVGSARPCSNASRHQNLFPTGCRAPRTPSGVRNRPQPRGGGHDRFRLGFVDSPESQADFLNLTAPPHADIRVKGVAWREAREPIVEKALGWSDIAGYADLKARLKSDLLAPLIEPDRYKSFGIGAPNGLLLYGLPGCGKSLIGRVLLGLAGLTCRRLVPSDLTSMWLGQGVERLREVFTWALKQAPSMLIIDELDGVAPQRSEIDMHTDEKRQVNELLAQLDRLSGRSIVVVATTNYARGIDPAVRRSGRFDLKIPVFPPTRRSRAAISASPRSQTFRGHSSDPGYRRPRARGHDSSVHAVGHPLRRRTGRAPRWAVR